MRYQLWRAAALRRRRRRDDPDKLLATYRDFGPRDINGNYPEYGYCIWRRPPKYTDARYRDRIRYEASDELGLDGRRTCLSAGTPRHVR